MHDAARDCPGTSLADLNRRVATSSKTRILLLTTLTLAACDRSLPTSPEQALEIGCSEQIDGYQCRASVLSDAAATKDVTGLATWSTSDTQVATVNSVGFVTVLKDGEVAIRAEYKGTEGFVIMRVEAGGLRRYYRALSGWVTDAATSSKLATVKVEIVDGPSSGRSAFTGSDGAYQLYDLEVGSFRVRFTKSGYAPLERSVTLTGSTFTSLDAALTR